MQISLLVEKERTFEGNHALSMLLLGYKISNFQGE